MDIQRHLDYLLTAKLLELTCCQFDNFYDVTKTRLRKNIKYIFKNTTRDKLS